MWHAAENSSPIVNTAVIQAFFECALLNENMDIALLSLLCMTHIHFASIKFIVVNVVWSYVDIYNDYYFISGSCKTLYLPLQKHCICTNSWYNEKHIY